MALRLPPIIDTRGVSNQPLVDAIAQAIGGRRQQQREDEIFERDQEIERQKAEALTQVESEKNRLTSLFTEIERLKNVSDPIAVRNKVAQLGAAEIQAGRDGSAFIEVLNSNTPDELHLALGNLATIAGNEAGRFDEVLKANKPAKLTAETTIGKARQDLNKGLITQDQFDRFVAGELAEKEAAKPTAATELGKITQDFKNGFITREQMNTQTKLVLDAEAAELAGEGELDTKDLISVNDKVSKIIQPTQDIVSAAESLAGLEERATPAAKLAAVFKFMKAMDPSSTVRESEQGQVLGVEGTMKGLINQINAALGEGGISEAGFRDLVNTARQMSNSAIDTTQSQLSGYVGVFEDKLTPVQLNKIKKRIPKRFEIGDEPVNIIPPVQDLDSMSLEQLQALEQQLLPQ